MAIERRMRRGGKASMQLDGAAVLLDAGLVGLENRARDKAITGGVEPKEPCPRTRVARGAIFTV